jgi:hypothetical protein
MSYSLPERVQILGHAHIICITVREDRIISCQIFCDVLTWLFIFSSRGHDRQSLEQNNRKLISLHNNGKDDKHVHGFADF